MEYTKLGRTGLDVSRICLGCMSYGGGNLGNHAWSLPEEESRPFIKKALEAGINFFDTANRYSLGNTAPRLTPPAAARGAPGLALRSARRVVGRQLFTALLDRLGVDQDEREDRRLRALGDPGVHRAALHADVARLHRHRAAVVEFEVAFTL